MLSGLMSPARDARHKAKNRLSARFDGQRLRLLAVVLQNLVAGLADLGAVFLETRQDGEVALIDHRAAELLHVAVTGLLLFRRSAACRLLGEGSRRNRDR